MTDMDTVGLPFDMFSLAEDMRTRFGWSNDDLDRAMQMLMPAATSGFKHFGDIFSAGAVQGSPFTFPALASPADFFASFFETPANMAVKPFFGPDKVKAALAGRIAELTGLNRDGIQELMPVAATLAMGQMLRPFVQGEAQVLMDAYLRGFARGRPKPTPTPVDYLRGYTDAMQSFWGAVLKSPLAQVSPQEPVETEPEPEEEALEVDLPADDEQPEREEASEFDQMVSGWMAAGRDMQSNQFKLFDTFFSEESGEEPAV